MNTRNIAGLFILSVFVSAAGFAAEPQVEKVKVQELLDARISVATPAPAAPGAAPGATPKPEPAVGVIINLDNTGVLDWRFLNPRRPVLVEPGSAVQFRNNTVDRTFSISVPVSVKTTDADFKYSVGYRPYRAFDDRSATILAAATLLPLTAEEKSRIVNAGPELNATILENIDRLMRVRELIASRDVLDKLAEIEKTAGGPAPGQSAIDMTSLRTLIRKPHADRITALEARLKQLQDLSAVNKAGALPGSPAPNLAAELEVAHTTLAQKWGELAKVPTEDTKKREQLTAEIKTAEERIVNLRRGLAGASVTASVADKDAISTEMAAVERELNALRGDKDEIERALADLEGAIFGMSLGDKTASGSVERTRVAIAAVTKSLDGRLEQLVKDRKAAFDTPISNARDAVISQRRSARTMFDRKLAQTNDELIGRADAALALLDSLGKTGTTVALTSRFGGAEIRGCSEDDGKFACSAVQNVPPGGNVTFGPEFLSAIGKILITFTVRFFDEADEPANPTAYVTLQENPPPPKNEFSWSLTGSVGQKRDPEIAAKSDTGPCAGFQVCVDGHRNHFNGGARLDLKQKILNFIEASASVQFREGDLGTKELIIREIPADGVNPAIPATTRDQLVTIPKFQFNVYSEIGLNLQFGKFSFAELTNKISVNESGEGFRLLYRNVGGAYIIKRESNDALTANRANRDSTVAILQLSNLPVATVGPVRSISLIALRGEDKTIRKETPNPNNMSQPTVSSPYTYQTYGGEVRYAIPWIHVNGLAGGYWSRRDSADDALRCAQANTSCNGEGNVWMATATRSFVIDTKNRARRSLALTWAQGSADNRTTETRDEGYIGEKASFAPDLIFMSSFLTPFIKANISSTDTTPVSPFGVGGTLSNKRYRSIKYVENAFSPLLVIVRDWLGVSENDIAGYQTIVTYHDYRLRRGLASAERDLGQEIDIEFQLESPKGVKTFIRGGYYRPGDAVKPWLDDDVWTIATGISISI